MWRGKLRSGQRWGLYFRWEIFTVTALWNFCGNASFLFPISIRCPQSTSDKTDWGGDVITFETWAMCVSATASVCDWIQYSTCVCVCVSIKSRFLCLCLWVFVCVSEKNVCEYARLCIWICLCSCVCDSESGSNNVHLLKCSCDVLVVSTPVHSRKKYYTFYFTTCIWYL